MSRVVGRGAPDGAPSDRGIPTPPTAGLSATAGRTIDRDDPLAPAAAWDPAVVSRGYVAGYKPFTALDGEGVRCALYVSGCLFQCPGCFNEAAWSFRFGRPYDVELEDRVLADLARPPVQGLSLLGGEPMLNTATCLALVRRVRAELPGKDVWCWTGYTYEWLLDRGRPEQRELLDEVDVLVDGPFRKDLKDLGLPFRGSTNQRVLDVRSSLDGGRAIGWSPA